MFSITYTYKKYLYCGNKRHSSNQILETKKKIKT